MVCHLRPSAVDPCVPAAGGVSLAPRGAPAPGRGHDRPIHAPRSVLGWEGSVGRGRVLLLVLLPALQHRRGRCVHVQHEALPTGHLAIPQEVRCLPWGVGVALGAHRPAGAVGWLHFLPHQGPGAAPLSVPGPCFPSTRLDAHLARLLTPPASALPESECPDTPVSQPSSWGSPCPQGFRVDQGKDGQI